MSSFFKPSEVKTKQESKGSSTQKGVLDKNQEALNQSLFDKIIEAIGRGPEVSQSDRNVARGQINDTYDATGKQLESNLAARGFSTPGGKLGKSYGDLAIARNKAFASTESDLKSQAMQRFQQMISNAFQFDQPRQYDTNTTGSQVNTQPGPSIFDRILGYAGQGLGGAVGLGWQPFH